MKEHYTLRLLKIVELAEQEATRRGHDHIGTEHLLIGFLREGTGVGAHVLRSLGVDLSQARADVDATMKPGTEKMTGPFRRSAMAQEVLDFAEEEARELNRSIPGADYVGSEHLLLGMLRQPECRAAVVLMKHGVEIEKARAEVRKLLGIEERRK